MHSIAIFGGTFDPVHNGHLQTSITIQSSFHFDSFYFLPCKMPTIKPPTLATNQQRIEMLELAIQNMDDFHIDLREMNRDTPSYMVDTLKSFREEDCDASITLILGFDAFLLLPKWHQWEELIKLANLLIINRAGFNKVSIPKPLQVLLNTHQLDKQFQLLNYTAGVICFFDAGNFHISSSALREEIKQCKNVKTQIPEPVYEYIKNIKLYQ